jgi:hypothetical protein
VTTLDRGFEDDLREAVLDDVIQKLRDDHSRAFKEVAAANWRAYASRHDYDIDHVWEDAEGPFVERDGDSVTMRVKWPELTALFEFGVSPHTIEGDPLLSFVWEGPPEGTRPPDAPKHISAQSVNWGSVTGGIPESRAIRDALNGLRQVLRS